MLLRIREIMSGPASAALVLLMLIGCLCLWVGVPLGWLWIGSQVQGVLVPRHRADGDDGRDRPVDRGPGASCCRGSTAATRSSTSAVDRPVRSSALEVMLVSSAGLAVVAFAVWFFLFAGASPLPLNISF